MGFPDDRPLVGQSIGNYVVTREIGRGGMGTVYLARHNRLAREVAIKVLQPEAGRSPEQVTRFFNEARAATDIRNPHIVDVLDFGELPDGACYIVMEHLEGRSLAQVLRDEGRLPPARAAHVAAGLADALEAAHARGVVHRDLKPDNIFLVTRDGDPDYVKVLDFGIAKLTRDEGAPWQTQTGFLLGTPHYMSPEQCRGEKVDARADVYAMGVIVYQMLTGHLPFSGSTLVEILTAHLSHPAPPPRSLDPTLSAAVESAVLRALEKDRALRFGSVRDFARAVEAPASPPAPPGPPPPPPFMAPPPVAPAAPPPVVIAPPSGNRLVLAGVGVLVAVLGLTALVLLAVVLGRKEPTPAPVPIPVTTPAAAPTSAPRRTTASPRPAAPAPAPTTTRWVLQQTDCPPRMMPPRVETEQVGTTFVSRAPGYPDGVSTIQADGSFVLRNALGGCSGHVTATTVRETCFNVFRQSCHATYTRLN